MRFHKCELNMPSWPGGYQVFGGNSPVGNRSWGNSDTLYIIYHGLDLETVTVTRVDARDVLQLTAHHEYHLCTPVHHLQLRMDGTYSIT